jgi:thioredoxin 1
MTTNPENKNPLQQLINGELKPLVGMEATSSIPVIKSKAEYLKAVMYEGVRLFQKPQK